MRKQKLLEQLKTNPFFLAPMAGITDSPFRSFMKEMGCGFVTTELVSAKSLEMGNEKSYNLMAFEECQRPVGIQIFGEELSSFSVAAKIVEQMGVDFLDLNFGCPVSKIIKKGAGSAILKDLSFLRKVLRAVCGSTCLPVSIKIRTGWDINSKNSTEVAKIAADEGIIWLAIHGRTRKQGYSGRADWNYITEVKKQSLLPVIGNGDLIKSDQILELKKQSGCDGMMIGRGCLKNPWIFQEVMRGKGHDLSNQNILFVLSRLKYHLEKFYEEQMFLLQYKKFCAWFSSGWPNSSNFRKKIFQETQKKQVLDMVEQYFSPFEMSSKEHKPYDASLLQGHG